MVSKVLVSLSVLIGCPAVRIDEDAVGSSKKNVELEASTQQTLADRQFHASKHQHGLHSSKQMILDKAFRKKTKGTQGAKQEVAQPEVAPQEGDDSAQALLPPALELDAGIAQHAEVVASSAGLVGDCYEACDKKTGWCDWCGKDKVCCRKDWKQWFSDVPLECQLAYDFVQDKHHECAPTKGHRECWQQNGKKGGFSDFCGKDSFGEPRACCREGATKWWFGADPKECKRAISFTQKKNHECVDLGPPANCWDDCNKKSGFCDACGHGRACCKEGKANSWWNPDARECKKAKSFTQKRHHECAVVSDALDCFNACGKKGGWCPQTCGEGKACCRKNFHGNLFTSADPEECRDAHGHTQDRHHECLPAFKKCANVCHTDKCLGTGYNPIPNGTRWTKVGDSTSSGCCGLGLGKCDRCCQE